MARLKTADPVVLLFFYALLSEMTWLVSYMDDYFYDKYDVNPNTTKACLTNISKSDAEKKAQSESSEWLLYLELCALFPSVIVALLIGGWSDKHGRRLLMVLPLIGACCLTAVFLVVVRWDLPISYMFIGGTAFGLFGGQTVLSSAMYSYTVDVSTMETRTMRIGIMSSMLSIGGGSGRVVGGVVLQYVGSYCLLFLSLACYILSLLYVIFIMDGQVSSKDSKTNEDMVYNASCNEASSDNNSNSCNLKSFTGAIQLFKRNQFLRPRWNFLLSLIAFGLYSLVSDGIPNLQYLYFLGPPLCWDSSTIGYFFGLSYVSLFLGSSAFLVLFTKVLRMRDTAIVLLGAASATGGYIVEAFANSSWSMFLVPVVGLMSGTVVPTTSSMMSKCVVKQSQGALFSVAASLETMSTVLALVVFNPMYAATNQDNIDFLPNSGAFSFLIMAVICAVIFALILFLHCSEMCKHVARTDSEASLLVNEDHDRSLPR